MAHDRIVGVPGHVKHVHVRTDYEQSLSQASPAHARHHDVRQQKVDWCRVLFAQEQRIPTTLSVQYVVPVFSQNRARKDADGFIVFD
jgi:hypothetical protein